MIDSHCHLDFKGFAHDRDAVLERARAAGVSQIVVIGMVPSSIDRVLPLVESHPPERMTATAGVHPHDAGAWSDDLRDQLLRHLDHPRVTALGECGLDWFRNYAPVDLQHAAFRAQLEIARDRDLPFVLHCREAFDDCYAAIREIMGDRCHPRDPAAGERPLGITHCFSGDAGQAAKFRELGMLISWAGHVTYKKSTELQEAARATPLEHWLVETDAPFLTPIPNRGKRNEPAFTADTARFLADLTGHPLADIDRITTRNARLAFGLPSTAGDGS